MNSLKLPRDQVAALRAEDLQQYLHSTDWKPEDASSDLATVYRKPGEPDLGRGGPPARLPVADVRPGAAPRFSDPRIRTGRTLNSTAPGHQEKGPYLRERVVERVT